MIKNINSKCFSAKQKERVKQCWNLDFEPEKLELFG